MDYFDFDLETTEAPDDLALRLAIGFGEATLEGRDTESDDVWEADDARAA